MNTLGWLESVWQDVRYGARVLRKSPAFTVVALLSLALGVGANGAIFQLLDIVRLRVLPLSHPEEIVEVRIAPNGKGRTGEFQGFRPALTNPLWEQIRDRQTSLTTLFASGNTTFDLSSGGESRPANGIYVSGMFFRALEGRAVAGRLLGPDDDVRGCPSPGAVVSHGFWQRELGGVPDVSGRMLRLDGTQIPVVGVVHRGFSGIEVGRRLDIFVPICSRPLINKVRPAIEERSVWWLAAFGRLNPGVSVERAGAEVATLSGPIMESTVEPRYAAPEAKNYRSLQLNVYPASTGVSGLRARYADSLFFLLSIAGLVLLIACANLANLMLARASARGREIAVRLAIGASRGRVFRQLIAEGLLLSGLGAFAGLWLALGLSHVLVSILTADSPWQLDLGLDWRLTAFTMSLAVVTCVVFAVMPAVRATNAAPGLVLRTGGRGMTAGRESFLTRRLLVVGQIAVSFVLVVGALLFVGTLKNLAKSDTGFDDRGVLQVDLDMRSAGVARDALLTFQSTLLARLAAVPAVTDATWAAVVPLSGSGWNESIIIDGKTMPGYPDANRVSAGFFHALRIPFVAGRTFDGRDHAGTTTVAVVNESFVEKYLPGTNPIGRSFRIQVGPKDPDIAYQVIGIVKNTKYHDLRDPLGPQMYFADTQEAQPAPYATALLRTDGDPDGLRGAVTRAVAEVHPSILLHLDTVSSQVRGSLLRERLMAVLSGGFAVLAVILAAVGLYGVTSYGVTRRRNEIGIRVALGATRGRIVTMIVRETAMLVAAGVVFGIAAAVFAGRAAEALLYGLTSADPRLLGIGVVALAGVAAIASLLPAARAARMDPTTALRDEA